MSGSITQRLATGQTLIGAVINIVHPTMIELVCGAGADFLFLDFEHGLRDFSDVNTALITSDLCDVPTLVRVGERSENLVARMLDAGAAGILFPHVKTAAQASEFASWCRYKPLGIRGSGFARGSLRIHGSEFARRQQASQDVVCIMMVEDTQGAENLEAILRVDGVTGVAIGPGDLSMDLGVDRWDHPRVEELLERMSETVRRFPGRALLRLCLTPDELPQRLRSGANMIIATHDVHLIGAMYSKLLSSFRSALGPTQ